MESIRNQKSGSWSYGVIFLLFIIVCCSLSGCSSGGEEASIDPTIVENGVFIDSPVEGLIYKTGTQSGVTDASGTFKYIEGETVSFYLADVYLGSGKGKDEMSPIDLVPAAQNETHPTVTNICRFIQSLDIDGNLDNGIRITEEIREEVEGRSIDFQQSIGDFENDYDVISLFDVLNSLGIFPDYRELRTAHQAQCHLRAVLEGIPEVCLAALAVTPTQTTVPLGISKQFTAIATGTDDNNYDVTEMAEWSSQNLQIASVGNQEGSRGVSNSAGLGTTTISATLYGVTATAQLTVSEAELIEIELTPEEATLPLGKTKQFTAIGIFTDGSKQDITADVQWTSSNTAVATIGNAAGAKGAAVATTPGETMITASLNGLTRHAQLTVTTAGLVSIEIAPANSTLVLGGSKLFMANGHYTDGTVKDITQQADWASSNPGVAIIGNTEGSKGLVTSVGVGSTAITATMDEMSNYTHLTVTPAELLSLEITPENTTVTLGFTKQFTLIGNYTDDTTQDLTIHATWASSDTSVATISNTAGSKGLAATVSEGVTTIGASIEGIAASTQLIVTKANLMAIQVEPQNAVVVLGFTKRYTATGVFTDGMTQNITDKVTWSTSDSSLVTISNEPGSKGMATPILVGTVTVSATYSGITGSTTLEVQPASLKSIQVTPLGDTLQPAYTKQFKATGNYSNGATQDLTVLAAWSSSNTSVAVVSNQNGTQGLVTGVSEGTTTINASYNGIVGSAQLTVEE